MRWTVHLDGGPRRVNHAAVSVGGLIFSFGGYCTGDNYRDPQPIDVFVLNTATYRWSALKKPSGTFDVETSDWPYQRYGHTVVAWGKKVVLFGGRSDHNVCNTVYVFDTATFEWTKFTNHFGNINSNGRLSDFRSKLHYDMRMRTRSSSSDKPSDVVHGNIPMARDGHSACLIGDAMYIYGGYVEAEQFCGDIYRLDLDEMRWELLVTSGDLPAYRDFHTATAIGDKMYIFGGRCCPRVMLQPNHEYYCSEVRYFDTRTRTWCKPVVGSSDDVPEGRRSHSALNYNGNLIVFGGYNSVKSQHKNDLWMFDTEFNRWKRLEPAGKGPGPRRRQALCLVGNRIFLFGGTSPYDGPPIVFTTRQLELMNELLRDESLVDHSDLYVLDASPSLKTLCMDTICRSDGPLRVDWEKAELPAGVIQDMKNMTTRNNISQPLKTLASG